MGSFSLTLRDSSAGQTGGKPILTLYTKDPCPLCDKLVEQLEPFKERFVMEKVDITKRENLRYLRLYRNDIPVLHLNGQFLCMHRLNAPLLINKLNDIENVWATQRLEFNKWWRFGKIFENFWNLGCAMRNLQCVLTLFYGEIDELDVIKCGKTTVGIPRPIVYYSPK